MQTANVILALYQLGKPQALWDTLVSLPDSRLRAFLIDRIASLNCAAGPLIDQLSLAEDAGVRQAVLMALSDFPPKQFSDSELQTLLAKATELAANDSDAGVHSTASQLLGKIDAARSLMSAPSPLPLQPNRSWYVADNGHVMSVIRGPVKFQMGSAPHSVDRNVQLERLHTVNIDRSFAVSTKEVTVEQFLEFQPGFDFVRHRQQKKRLPHQRNFVVRRYSILPLPK